MHITVYISLELVELWIIQVLIHWFIGKSYDCSGATEDILNEWGKLAHN